METSFLWFGVFSGSFGVRSIVLCKCSGKYIDIYFKLKITFLIYYMTACYVDIFQVLLSIYTFDCFRYCICYNVKYFCSFTMQLFLCAAHVWSLEQSKSRY